MCGQKNDIYAIREALPHKFDRCVCVMPVDHEKAPVLRVFRGRFRDEDLCQPFNSDSFLHPPLLRRRELPAIVIFEGDGKPLLLNAQPLENNEGIEPLPRG